MIQDIQTTTNLQKYFESLQYKDIAALIRKLLNLKQKVFCDNTNFFLSCFVAAYMSVKVKKVKQNIFKGKIFM